MSDFDRLILIVIIGFVLILLVVGLLVNYKFLDASIVSLGLALIGMKLAEHKDPPRWV